MIESEVNRSPVLGEATIEDLRLALRGTLVRPESFEYERARRVWNGRIDRFPALIVRAAGAEDVRRAVQFARSYKLEVAVRGGGHSIAGWGTTEGGMVVDLGALRKVEVDLADRTARVDPGVTVGELIGATERHGWITPLGISPPIGIAGLTLGGGLGWLTAKHGLTVDNLLAADVVLADGRGVRASAEENADLFWAVRGGGGNFGVITSFVFQLHPADELLAGLIAHPARRAREVLRFYRDFTQGAPDELTAHAFLGSLADGLPSIVLGVAHCGTGAIGERRVEPARRFGRPMLDSIWPRSHRDLSQLFDTSAPAGLAYASWVYAVPALTDDVVDALSTYGVDPLPPGNELLVQHVHGKATRVGISETPIYGLRRPHYEIAVRAAWSHGDGAAEVTRAKAVGQALVPHANTAVYLNYVDDPLDVETVRSIFGPNFDRLAAIKAHYDPTNFFHLNPNVAPAPDHAASRR
jgi:FAD/FMN-containing dehydrogenase